MSVTKYFPDYAKRAPFRDCKSSILHVFGEHFVNCWRRVKEMPWSRTTNHICQTDPDMGPVWVSANGPYIFSHWQVGMAGMKELLQTCRSFTPLSNLIKALLRRPSVPGPAGYPEWLLWDPNGPGVGKEIRTSVSNLFGRFFARAYLEHEQHMDWIVPISGEDQVVLPDLKVRRRRGVTGHLADWVCATDFPGVTDQVLIAEAKGAHRASRVGNFVNPPDVLLNAVQQISRTEVWYEPPGTAPALRSVKGWAILSKWGASHRGHGPFLHVIDPYTKGAEPFSEDELPKITQGVAKTHVALLLSGLGFEGIARRADPMLKRSVGRLSEDTAGKRTSLALKHVSARIERSPVEDEIFVGAVYGLGGHVAGPTRRVLEAVRSLPLPFADHFLFVGMLTTQVEKAVTRDHLTPWRLSKDAINESVRNQIYISPDGFVVAPARLVAPGKVVGLG